MWSWEKALVLVAREAKTTILCHPVKTTGEHRQASCLEAHSIQLGGSRVWGQGTLQLFLSNTAHLGSLLAVAKKTPIAEALRQLEGLCFSAPESPPL